jgi:hypothetical protein
VSFVVHGLKFALADVFLTEYEDGTRFVVNYGTRPYDYSGTTVMGNSFAVFDKEGQIQ